MQDKKIDGILNKKFMEGLFALPFLLLPFALPVIAGYLAKRFERSFWLWFWISIPLPFISCFIILWLPDRSISEIPVESNDIFKELNGIN